TANVLFFSSRRRHTRCYRDWSSDVCSSDLNVKAESLRLGDFSQPEVGTLYRQHTDETGQPFTPEALVRVWELTEGQPWLVNALRSEERRVGEEGRERWREDEVHDGEKVREE